MPEEKYRNNVYFVNGRGFTQVVGRDSVDLRVVE